MGATTTDRYQQSHHSHYSIHRYHNGHIELYYLDSNNHNTNNFCCDNYSNHILDYYCSSNSQHYCNFNTNCSSH